MINRVALVVAMVCAVAAPMAARAASVEKFRNEKVVVTERTLAAGGVEVLDPSHAGLVVYMSDGRVKVSFPGAPEFAVTAKPGGTTFLPGGVKVLQNVGDSPLHLAVIEFLTSGKDETWGMMGLLPSYKMVHEDRNARVYEIRGPAGAVEPQHTHHARAVVCLSGTEIEHTLPDGTKQLATLKTGDILWREAATHAGHNLGKAELWEIVVEPK
jgi:quercetin dioxygenase-like cupin family protein